MDTISNLSSELLSSLLNRELTSVFLIGQNLGKRSPWQQTMKTFYGIQKAAKSGVPHIHILDMIGGIYFR